MSDQTNAQEINTLIQLQKQKSLEPAKEVSSQEKSFQLVRIALEEVEMIMETEREPSKQELIAFHRIL